MQMTTLKVTDAQCVTVRETVVLLLFVDVHYIVDVELKSFRNCAVAYAYVMLRLNWLDAVM